MSQQRKEEIIIKIISAYTYYTHVMHMCASGDHNVAGWRWGNLFIFDALEGFTL